MTGWPSFLHGEATAGDVLSMRVVRSTLTGAGFACDLAWSPGFRPGELSLDDADPAAYTDLVFTCGPAHGEQVRWLHRRFAACRRTATGVSVLDWHDPAVSGFHRVYPRDAPDFESTVDLAAFAPVEPAPVAGVVLAPGQREYGERRRHDEVHDRLRDWLGSLDCAVVEADTRLDTGDWRKCSTPDQVLALFARFDVVVTTRLHGLVLALRAGVPALAVDPVAGGGKVSAQAAAWRWPAIVGAEEATGPGAREVFDGWWRWCLDRRPR